jgi:hypothetical protein
MDADQYLFIDLGSRFYVTSIATQGRRAAKEYVTIYNLMYSDNGHNWFYYTDEDKIIVVSSPTPPNELLPRRSFGLF